jgi:hypothetical protein
LIDAFIENFHFRSEKGGRFSDDFQTMHGAARAHTPLPLYRKDKRPPHPELKVRKPRGVQFFGNLSADALGCIKIKSNARWGHAWIGRDIEPYYDESTRFTERMAAKRGQLPIGLYADVQVIAGFADHG